MKKITELVICQYRNYARTIKYLKYFIISSYFDNTYVKYVCNGLIKWLRVGTDSGDDLAPSA